MASAFIGIAWFIFACRTHTERYVNDQTVHRPGGAVCASLWGISINPTWDYFRSISKSLSCALEQCTPPTHTRSLCELAHISC